MNNLDLLTLINNLENNQVYDKQGYTKIPRELMQIIINALKSSKSLKCCYGCNNNCEYNQN